jgi:hypothetical protein
VSSRGRGDPENQRSPPHPDKRGKHCFHSLADTTLPRP